MEKLEIDVDEVLSSLIPSEAFKTAMNHVLNGPNQMAYTKPLPSRPLMFWTRSDYGILKEHMRLFPETIHKILTLPWAEVDHIADKLTLELREIAERAMLKRQTETLNFIKDKSIWKVDNSVDFETSKYFQDNKYTTSESETDTLGDGVPDWAPGAEGYDTLMGYTGYDGYFTEPWVNWSLMEDCNYQQMLRDEVPLAEETGIRNFVEFKSPFLPEYEEIVNEATFLDCDGDFAAVPATSGLPSGPMIPDWNDHSFLNYNCYSHYYQMYSDLESRMFMDNAVMTGGLDFEYNRFIPMDSNTETKNSSIASDNSEGKTMNTVFTSTSGRKNIYSAYPSSTFDYGNDYAHAYGAYTGSNNFYSMQGNNISDKANSFGPGTGFGRSNDHCPSPENQYSKNLVNLYRNPCTNNSGNVNRYPGPEHSAYDIYTKNLLAYASSLNEAYVSRMGGASADRLRNVSANSDLKDAYTQHENRIDTSLAYAFSNLTNVDTSTNTNLNGIGTDLTSMNLSSIDTGAHSNAFSRFDNTKTNNYTISTDNGASISSSSYYDQNNARFGSIDTSISSYSQTVIGNKTGLNFSTPVAGPSSATSTRIVYSNNGTRQVFRKSNNIYAKFYKTTKANYNRTFPPLSFGQNRTNGADEESSSDESGADEGPIIEIRGVSNGNYMLTEEGAKREFLCVFCIKQGEAEKVFKSHPIRVNGIVVCPFLRNHVCALCKATGDNAHTIKYCPQNKRGFFVLKALERKARTISEIEAPAAEKESQNF